MANIWWNRVLNIGAPILANVGTFYEHYTLNFSHVLIAAWRVCSDDSKTRGSHKASEWKEAWQAQCFVCL